MNIPWSQIYVLKPPAKIPVYSSNRDGYIVWPSAPSNNTVTISQVPFITSSGTVVFCDLAYQVEGVSYVNCAYCIHLRLPSPQSSISVSSSDCIHNIHTTTLHNTQTYTLTIIDILRSHYGSNNLCFSCYFSNLYDRNTISSLLSNCVFRCCIQDACLRSRSIIGFDIPDSSLLEEYLFVVHRPSFYRTYVGDIPDYFTGSVYQLPTNQFSIIYFCCYSKQYPRSISWGDYVFSFCSGFGVKKVRHNFGILDFCLRTENSVWNNAEISMKKFVELYYKKLFYLCQKVRLGYTYDRFLDPLIVFRLGGKDYLTVASYYLSDGASFNFVVEAVPVICCSPNFFTSCMAIVPVSGLYSKSESIVSVASDKLSNSIVNSSQCSCVRSSLLNSGCLSQNVVLVCSGCFSNLKISGCSKGIEYSCCNYTVCVDNSLRYQHVSPSNIITTSDCHVGFNALSCCSAGIVVPFEQGGSSCCFVHTYSVFRLTCGPSSYVMGGSCLFFNGCAYPLTYNFTCIPTPFVGGAFSEACCFKITSNCYEFRDQAGEVMFFEMLQNCPAYKGCVRYNCSIDISSWISGCCVRGIEMFGGDTPGSSGSVWLMSDIWADNVVIHNNTTVYTNGYIIGGNRIFIGCCVTIRSQVNEIPYHSYWRGRTARFFYACPVSGNVDFDMNSTCYINTFAAGLPNLCLRGVMTLPLGGCVDYSFLTCAGVRQNWGQGFNCFTFVPTLENLTTPHNFYYFTAHPTTDVAIKGSALCIYYYIEQIMPPIMIVANQICARDSWRIFASGQPPIVCVQNPSFLCYVTFKPAYKRPNSNDYTGLPVFISLVVSCINIMPTLYYPTYCDFGWGAWAISNNRLCVNNFNLPSLANNQTYYIVHSSVSSCCSAYMCRTLATVDVPTMFFFIKL